MPKNNLSQTQNHTRLVQNIKQLIADGKCRVAFSHGEGRFVADSEQLQQLIQNGQIATQYVDNQGNATMHPQFNPNGSTLAIEGLTSPDGRILGKMGHSERYAMHCYLNYPNFTAQNIFVGGVNYFR